MGSFFGKLKYFGIIAIGGLIILAHSPQAQACSNIPDCNKRTTENVNKYLSEKFAAHRTWLLDTFFKGQVLPALMLFTEQMSAVAMQQTFTIGTFIDAKHQLETQRLLQQLQNEAHKDYQPSESFCHFGTNVRSLAASEQRGRAASLYLSSRQRARHLGQRNIGGSESGNNDKEGRWVEFTENFCDPQDNNWFAGAGNNGLSLVCPNAVPFPKFTNADIDYTRLIENASTITNTFGFGLTLAGSTSPTNATPTKRSIYAMSSNLYGHDVLERPSIGEDVNEQAKYLALRSVVAKRSVAENSFNAIVGMKSIGTSSPNAATANTHEFMGAIMKELGMPEADIKLIIGREPSYYAQLELLSKRIFQNPDFYADLYDKPANVKRKRVALQAIELMLDRAIYESQMRQELSASVLLSARLHEPFGEINGVLGKE